MKKFAIAVVGFEVSTTSESSSPMAIVPSSASMPSALVASPVKLAAGAVPQAARVVATRKTEKLGSMSVKLPVYLQQAAVMPEKVP